MLAVLVVCTLALVAAGCGKSKSGKHLVGFSQCNLGEPWRVSMNAQVAARAKDFPDLEIAYADAQQDNAKQVADVENFLRQKIDLLIISPNEARPLTPIVKRVFDQGIPVIILAVSGTASLIRVMRANMLDELHKPYVTTARAKGLSEFHLLVKYPVRLALNPFISTISWLLPNLVSGSIIVAIVLSLPTAGPLLLQSLMSQDMYLAGAFVLLICALTLIGSLISDILLALVDPRIRLE